MDEKYSEWVVKEVGTKFFVARIKVGSYEFQYHNTSSGKPIWFRDKSQAEKFAAGLNT